MKLDIKTILALVVILFTSAGFYYNTISRLDDAEKEILFLHNQMGQLKKDNTRLNRTILRHVKKDSHKK